MGPDRVGAGQGIGIVVLNRIDKELRAAMLNGDFCCRDVRYFPANQPANFFSEAPGPREIKILAGDIQVDARFTGSFHKTLKFVIKDFFSCLSGFNRFAEIIIGGVEYTECLKLI